MAMLVKDVKEWISGMLDNEEIAIDDGGLSLVLLDENRKEIGVYIEIGGVPLPDGKEE